MSRRITETSEEWSEGLSHLGKASPRQLFVDGETLPPFDRSIAIVGTRRPTSTGLEIAKRFSKGLAEAGFAVVSGLAVGIDAAAHAAAVRSGGHTVAVLGCGLNVNYPLANQKLKESIRATGTLVTEHDSDVQPQKHHFPQRNRLIAALARGVVVVEGGQRSGALITARLALDLDRHVWAVPGSIRNAAAAGPNSLVRAGAAALVTELSHVFEDVAPQMVWENAYSPGAPSPALQEDEALVLSTLDDVPTSHDQISIATDLAGGSLALALTRLEIRGLARRVSAGYELTEAGARAARPLFAQGSGIG